MPKPKPYPRMEMRKLDTLKAHPDGVRTASPVDEFRLGKSIAHFGLLRVPFVLNARTGALLDGDRMLRPLRESGIEEVPVWVIDIEEEDEDAAHLALQNHVGEWQWQSVSLMLKAIAERNLEVGLTGFHDSDTGPLMAADWTPKEKGPLDGSDPKQGGLF